MDTRIIKDALSHVIAKSQKDKIRVVFFGGEPMLAPLSWYEEALKEIRADELTSDKTYHLGIQTNGTVLTAKHLDFIKDNNIQLSVSLDGPPSINNQYREKGELVERNLKRAKAYGIDVGVIALISPASWYRLDEVLSYFESMGLYKVRFNTCYSIGRGRDMQMLKQEQLAFAHNAIFDYMIKTSGKKVFDRNMFEKISFLAKNEFKQNSGRSGCSMWSCHAGDSYFSIDMKGGIYPCSDVTFTRPDLYMGSIYDDWDKNESRAKATQVRNDFNSKGDWWKKCASCEAKIICDYGCPAFIAPGAANINLECQSTKSTYRYLCNHKQEIKALFESLTYSKLSNGGHYEILSRVIQTHGKTEEYQRNILRNGDSVIKVEIDDAEYEVDLSLKKISLRPK